MALAPGGGAAGAAHRPLPTSAPLLTGGYAVLLIALAIGGTLRSRR